MELGVQGIGVGEMFRPAYGLWFIRVFESLEVSLRSHSFDCPGVLFSFRVCIIMREGGEEFFQGAQTLGFLCRMFLRVFLGVHRHGLGFVVDYVNFCDLRHGRPSRCLGVSVCLRLGCFTCRPNVDLSVRQIMLIVDKDGQTKGFQEVSQSQKSSSFLTFEGLYGLRFQSRGLRRMIPA